MYINYFDGIQNRFFKYSEYFLKAGIYYFNSILDLSGILPIYYNDVRQVRN